MNNPNAKKYITIVIWVLILFGIIYMITGGFNTQEPDTLSFSEFTALLDEGKIGCVKEILGQGSFYGLYSDSKLDMDALPDKADFTLVMSEDSFREGMSAYLITKQGLNKDEITSADYPYSFEVQQPQSESWLLVLLPYLILGGAMVFLVVMIMRQQGGGKQMMNFGKSRAHLMTDGESKVTFADVAGADEEKQELAEIVSFMKDPKRFDEAGARVPKGVLLVGPPGTGKTLLAKAVAGEAKAPFFSISGSDFVEMFVGVGASRVRDLFDTAKRCAPAVVFIDEIDAVGRHRGAGLGGGNDEREQTLNQLLVEMDGFASNQGLVVLAATNRADILDPALLRPGRFDRRIMVNYPDVKGREAILHVHARNKSFESDVDFSVLARRTPYFTGADLENVLNEGAILAVRNGRKTISMDDLNEAITRVQMGPEKKSHVVTEEDKRITACHECGHAILALCLPKCDKLQEVSIISRGMAAGYTMTLPENEQSHQQKSRMLDEICMTMGGRVAEALVYNDVSSGASQDIKQASSLARKMVEEWGMSDAIGPVFLGGDDEVFIGKEWGRSRSYSEVLAARIDEEVHTLIDTQYKRAVQLLTEQRAALDRCTELLMELERVSGEEFEAVFRGNKTAKTIQAAGAETPASEPASPETSAPAEA